MVNIYLHFKARIQFLTDSQKYGIRFEINGSELLYFYQQQKKEQAQTKSLHFELPVN